ncbi:MAG: hypothetical protein E6K68_10010 [Nitrospirae bacterium]|nr:MAG: hypothetical protein E6K68_10010 [Nitrospirota bacterium]
MTKRVQWLALFLLLGVWAGVGIWVIAGAPEPQRAPLKYVTGRASRTEASRSQAGAGLQVNLALLEAARHRANQAFVAPKNIFAPLPTEKNAPTHTKRKAPGQAPAPVPAPAVAAPAVPPPPSPEELAAEAARQELAQYRYLGYLSRNGREEAFLAKGTELYIVKSDETIEQRVRVKTVTPTGVTLQEPRSQVERTIPLVEGKP